VAPVSSDQRRFIDMQATDWLDYNLAVTLRLSGAIDSPAVVRAVDQLFFRHEALRTTLRNSGGLFTQVVWPFRTPVITNLHVRSAESLQDYDVRRAVANAINAPFALDGELSRVVIVTCRDRSSSILIVVMNHAIADEESCRLVNRELQTLIYDPDSERVTLPPAVPFREYVAGEEQEDYQRHADYWASRLTPTQFDLPPIGLPAGTSAAPVGALTFEPLLSLNAKQVAELGNVARTRRMTLGSVVFAATAIGLSRWTPDAILLGIGFSNRVGRFKSVVGPLASGLSIRVDLRSAPTVNVLLDCVGTDWLDALSHRVPRGFANTIARRYGSDRSSHDVVVQFIPFAPLNIGRALGSGEPEVAVKWEDVPVVDLRRVTPRRNDGCGFYFFGTASGTIEVVLSTTGGRRPADLIASDLGDAFEVIQHARHQRVSPLFGGERG